MTVKDFIIKYITYIQENGNNPKEWYVGKASNPNKRLFEELNIDKKADAWIYNDAKTEENARIIEEYLIENLGANGDKDGEGEDTTWIYAYKTNYSMS